MEMARAWMSRAEFRRAAAAGRCMRGSGNHPRVHWRKSILTRRASPATAFRALRRTWWRRGPIHLAIIDGIETVAGGEGPWVNGFRTVRPGLLVAGTNCVIDRRRMHRADGL